MLSSVDLPLPDGPSSTTSSPGRQREVDALQRGDLELAHAIALGDGRGLERTAVLIVGTLLNAVQVMTTGPGKRQGELEQLFKLR